MNRGTADRAIVSARFCSAAVVILMASLTGCSSSISDRTAATFTVAPGRYDIYTCQYIASLLQSTRSRQDELEKLMARASQDTGGTLVNTMVYRSEYLQVRGTLVELKQQLEKCAIESQLSSGRALF